MSFTKNPMNPMMAKPTAVAIAILWNSTVGGKGGYLKHNLFTPHQEVYIPLRSGFVHLCISRFESFMNSFTGFTYATTWSISTRR